MNKTWSVYIHINKVNSKKYIGITSQDPEYRWGINGSRYKKGVFRNAINKYGWDSFDHIILCSGKSEEEAKEIEKYLIRICDSKVPHGYNMTDGGDGTLGAEMSPEARAKIGEASKKLWQDDAYRKRIIENRHKPDSTYQSEEFKKKISGLVSGDKNPNYNNHWSDEQKESLRQKQKSNPMYNNETNPNAKKIRCIETGEIFACMKYAQERFGLKSTGSFTSAIKKGKTAAGFHWEYVDQ